MTTTSALPFSPLTDAELNERTDDAAWMAVTSLTFGDRYPGASPSLLKEAERALVDARLANEYHRAALLRIER